MEKLKTVVDELAKSLEKLVGYQEIDLHIILDFKLGENFSRKTTLVVGGQKTKNPSSITYRSLVSQDSVCICLLITSLNDLDL